MVRLIHSGVIPAYAGIPISPSRRQAGWGYLCLLDAGAFPVPATGSNTA